MLKKEKKMMMKTKTNNNLEQACKDAFSNLKKKRKGTEEEELESVIENLFCKNSEEEAKAGDLEDLEMEIEQNMMLRKRKGSTLIDILDRPVKRKKRVMLHFLSLKANFGGRADVLGEISLGIFIFSNFLSNLDPYFFVEILTIF